MLGTFCYNVADSGQFVGMGRTKSRSNGNTVQSKLRVELKKS
jgi:hypothetical protein